MRSPHTTAGAPRRIASTRPRERRDALAHHDRLIAQLEDQQAQINDAVCHQQRAEQLARTLERSLSPPSLPNITGVDVAVHYEPSAPEAVGGDF